jgi:hypothetical protein
VGGASGFSGTGWCSSGQGGSGAEAPDWDTDGRSSRACVVRSRACHAVLGSGATDLLRSGIVATQRATTLRSSHVVGRHFGGDLSYEMTDGVSSVATPNERASGPVAFVLGVSASRSGARAVSGRVSFDPNRNGRCARVGVVPEFARGRLASLRPPDRSAATAVPSGIVGSSSRGNGWPVSPRLRLRRCERFANEGALLSRKRTRVGSGLRPRVLAVRDQQGVRALAGSARVVRGFGSELLGSRTKERCFCGNAPGAPGASASGSKGVEPRGLLRRERTRRICGFGFGSRGCAIEGALLLRERTCKVWELRLPDQVGAGTTKRSGFPPGPGLRSSTLRLRATRSGNDGSYVLRA